MLNLMTQNADTSRRGETRAGDRAAIFIELIGGKKWTLDLIVKCLDVFTGNWYATIA